MKRTLGNLLSFQLGWYACVRLRSLAAVGVVGVLVAVHLLTVREPKREAGTLGAALAASLFAEPLFHVAGVRYEGGALFPVWILALWVNFGTTLDHCLRWLQTRWILAAVAGALLAPATYLLASRMGAVTLPHEGYFALAAGYGLLTPLLLRFAARRHA